VPPLLAPLLDARNQRAHARAAVLAQRLHHAARGLLIHVDEADAQLTDGETRELGERDAGHALGLAGPGTRVAAGLLGDFAAHASTIPDRPVNNYALPP